MDYRRLHLVLFSLIFLCAAMLLLVGSWYSYTSTFDTATVGLMAVNILDGDRPLFFYGQPYFGALEAYLAALFLYLFGFSEFVISLSPISFTLGWILFSYLLFTRIHNKTAGLVAAACAAFPGYYVFWYSIATYGGYSAILCVGTATIWLSLRILQVKPKRGLLLLQSVYLGVFIGAGIWIHPLTFPYIAIAAGILGFFIVREGGRRPSVVLSLCATVIIGLCGFIPLYLETGSFFGGVSGSTNISWRAIKDALTTLFIVNIKELVVWNFSHIFQSVSVLYLIEYGSILLLFSISLLSLYVLLNFRNTFTRKVYYLIPISFCLLFLLMYTQHHMATLKAPRYAINLLVMILCVIWTLPIAGLQKGGARTVATVLFCFWIGYQIVGTVFFIVGNCAGARQEQKAIQAVVDKARAENLKSVVTYGDSLLGYKAQKFSMFAGNKIVFAHTEAERYSQNAQFAEADPARGYLTNTQFELSLRDILSDLGASFKVSSIGGFVLFSDILVDQQYDMRAVPQNEIKDVSFRDEDSENCSDFLLDGNQDPELNCLEDKTSSLVFDTGKLRSLCALWMFTFQDTSIAPWKGPGPFEVFVSENGLKYRKVYSSSIPLGNGLHAGNSIYIGGPRGKAEAAFTPVHARYIKVLFLNKNTSPITEIFVFETEGKRREEDSDDLKTIQKLIISEEIDFVFADRWVSAFLLQAFAKPVPPKKIALARHSTEYENTPLDSFVRRAKGQAVVCDQAVADTCQNLLIRQLGDSAILNRTDLQNYSFFSLNDSGIQTDFDNRSALLWNGHVPLQTRDMTLLAPWFHFLGAPIWRADFTKTAGLYHDGWTNGKGRFADLDYTIQYGKESELILYTHGWRGSVTIDSLQLSIVVNDKITLKFKGKKGDSYVFLLPGSLDKLDSLTVNSNTFVPPGPDGRSLGIDIKLIELQ